MPGRGDCCTACTTDATTQRSLRNSLQLLARVIQPLPPYMYTYFKVHCHFSSLGLSAKASRYKLYDTQALGKGSFAIQYDFHLQHLQHFW